jgi:hypothetical protein
MSRSKISHTFPALRTPDAPHTAVVAATPPTHDDIAKRAFEIYVKTGRRQGRCKHNWLQAEQDLRNEDKAACRSAQCSKESSEGLHQHHHHHRHQQ